MLYHYSNDDILAVEPGLNNRSVYGTGVRLSGGDCDVMFALLQVRGEDFGSYNTILWDSTPKKLTSTPTTFIQTFTTTSFYNSADQPASNYGDTKYYLGWVRSNIGSIQSTSFIQFVNGFDFSISQSQYGLDNKGDTSLILQSSFPAGFQNSDCDVLQGNAVIDRPGTLYYDVDYASSQYIAVNEEAILNNTAEFANVQNSNYTTLSHINPRYKGSRTTSPSFNVWSSSSVNTFGKLPTVSREKTYFAYFDFINGTAPELNNKSIAHIQFLVDQDGNTIPPDETKLYLTQNSFQTGETVFINLDDPLRFETPMNELNGSKTVIRGGSRVDALLYSDSGSLFSEEIQFDTGSFSVTNYQFGATKNNGSFNAVNGSVYTTYNWNTTTLDVGVTGSNYTWNLGSDKYTFESDTDTPVRFQNQLEVQFNAYGYFEFTLVKNWTSGAPTANQTLDQFYFTAGGQFQIFNINLTSGYQDFTSGDTVQLIYRAGYGSGTGIQFNLSDNDTFTSTNQINPDGTADTEYWYSSSVSWDRLWLSGSEGLSAAYGSKQIQTWEQASGENQNNPEFDPIIQNFTVEVGDEIRFNGAEAYSRMISEVKLPSEESDGLLKIKLNNSMSTAANEQHFLLRRYVDDASYVLIDTTKPDGSTSPGTMRSEYVTTKLEDNFAEATSNIIKSNAGS
jgi:hypothetical protein